MPTIDLGDPVPNLAIETRDISGNFADAGSVTLVITKPDNTTANPTVNHADVGKYDANYVPPDPGHYSVRWVATGVNQSAYTDSFDVLEANPRCIVSLADAKELLRFSGDSATDEELRRYNEASTHMIEQYMKKTVVRTPVVGEEHCVYGRRDVVFLRRRPVISLTAVATIDSLVTWDISTLAVNSTSGRVNYLPGSAALRGIITFDYVAGYTIIPANIQEAARIMIQHLWATRRGLGGNLITQQLPGFNIGFALPQSVKDLLGAQPTMVA